MTDDSPTLADTLHSLGYTYGPGEHPTSGFQCVYRDGAQVFRGRCWECWAWLREQGHDV